MSHTVITYYNLLQIKYLIPNHFILNDRKQSTTKDTINCIIHTHINSIIDTLSSQQTLPTSTVCMMYKFKLHIWSDQEVLHKHTRQRQVCSYLYPIITFNLNLGPFPIRQIIENINTHVHFLTTNITKLTTLL